MNIGITCYPTYGGSGVVATELGMELAKRGHEIHFICYDRPYKLPPYSENIYYHEVEVSKYPLFEYPPYSIALASKMVDIVTYNKLDVLHVHYAIPHAASAYLAKQMLGGKIPIITTLHGTDITIVGRDPSFFNITKFAMESSDVVTTVSEYLKEKTIDTFQLQKEIDVIHNFINPDQFEYKKCQFSDYDRPVLVHVSNFRKVKRIPDVIRVTAEVLKKKDVMLLMIGDGPERQQAENLCRELEICDHVKFLGKQLNVLQLLHSADIFLFPSERESFGLAALEAMICCKPVIASRSGGIPEVVFHGETGFLSEVGDIKDMARNVLRLLDDKDLYQKMASTSKEKALKLFHSDSIIPKYEAIYQKLLNE